MDFFAIVNSSLAHEGSTHKLEQLTCFFVGLCGGGDSDVHTTQLFDLIVATSSTEEDALHRLSDDSLKKIISTDMRVR